MNDEKIEFSNGTPRKLKFDQLRADYELFLQTFEKPSWLYRYLQRRHELSPLFLHRTLSYLKGRKSRNVNAPQQVKRSKFHLSSMRENLEKIETAGSEETTLESCLELTFSGFFHGPGFAEEIFHTNDLQKQSLLKDEFVSIDIHLIQVYHKRKKDLETPMDIINLGSCKAPWNPKSQLLPACSSFKLSIPAASFSENGRTIKTTIISITVSIMVPIVKKTKKSSKKRDVENGEPPRKRMKSEANESVKDVKQDNNNESPTDENELSEDTLEKRLASFSAELIVFDRYKNCLLSEGDYELLLQENVLDNSNKENRASWENQFKEKLGPFEAFCFGPTIKFRLIWDAKPSAPFLPAANSFQTKLKSERNIKPLKDSSGKRSKSLSSIAANDKQELDKVFYQFIYNSSTRQQTEAREGFSCAWCGLNCVQLYGLLRHLKCCHNRFSFMYTALKKGHRIDVCINDNFDSSLKHGNNKDIGFISLDGKPMKRKTSTEVIVGMHHKVSEDLAQFTEPDNEDEEGAKAIKGHDRQYYHTVSSQGFQSTDMDYDSDDDVAPDWMKDKTEQMIDEFTDVNSGEQKLMKLWNIHILSQGFIADSKIPDACKTFVEEYGSQIIHDGLVGNLLLHLNNMFEFQIIPQTTILQTMRTLRAMSVEE